MPTINYSTRELTAKIVYYGPGLCGKTTNLQYIHDTMPPDKRTKMLSLATESDRTLFFDFLPIEVGDVRGMKVRVQLYTVPGQVFYNETRKIVLKGADGVVFVADSQAEMLEANIESLKNLKENLQINNLDFKDLPHVLQYNKRDLKTALPVAALDKALNLMQAPTMEAAAKSGQGVHETLKLISRLVLSTLIEKYGTDREKRLQKDKVKSTPVIMKLGGGAPKAPVEAGGTIAMMSPFAAKKITGELPDLGEPAGTMAMMSPFANQNNPEAAPPEPAAAVPSPFAGGGAVKLEESSDAGGTVSMMSPFATLKAETPVPALQPMAEAASGTVAMMSPFGDPGALSAPSLLEAGPLDLGGGEDSGLEAMMDAEPTLNVKRYSAPAEELEAGSEIASAHKVAPALKPAAPAAPAASPARPKTAITGPIKKLEISPLTLTPDSPQTLEVPVIIHGKKGKLHLLLTVEMDD